MLPLIYRRDPTSCRLYFYCGLWAAGLGKVYVDCGLQIVGLEKVYEDCGLQTMYLEGSSGILDYGMCTSVSRRGLWRKMGTV